MTDPQSKIRLLATSLGVLLAACGGGGGGGGGGGNGFASQRCDTINGGTAQTVSAVDPGCINCTVTDADKASDNDPNSFAVLDATNSPQGSGVLIRSTAQSGVAYPAGRIVSAFVAYSEEPAGGLNTEMVVTMRTYSAGNLQEQQSAGASGCTSGCALQRQNLGVGGSGNQPTSFLWFRSRLLFDAVEIHYSAPGLHAGNVPLKVFGLCSDGAVGG